MQRVVMPRRLSVHHSQIQCPTAASCALYEVLYLWYWVLYLLTILKNQRLTARSWSQGHASSRASRPRPQNFVLEVEASPRGPHPCNFWQYAYWSIDQWVGWVWNQCQEWEENHSLAVVLTVMYMYVVMELYYKQTMHVAWWSTFSCVSAVSAAVPYLCILYRMFLLVVVFMI